MLLEKKGLFLVLIAAFISGFSIFLNKFAVAESNPVVFTALKNVFVAVFIFSIILLLKEFFSIKQLSKKQWARLAAIGLIGGSIPFALFFSALKMASAINAGFLQKTIFIFAAFFAIIFLKEKISRRFAVCAGLLLFANYLMFSAFSGFELADFLILIAVVFWAIENIISKQALKELSGSIVAFGRMFFGSLFLLLFLAFSGQLESISAFSAVQWQWVFVTSIPLLFYVLTFYSGLKHIPVSKATALLMLGQPITLLLSLAFLNQALSFNQAIGIVLTLSAILLLFASSYTVSFLRSKGFSFARTK